MGLIDGFLSGYQNGGGLMGGLLGAGQTPEQNLKYQLTQEHIAKSRELAAQLRPQIENLPWTTADELKEAGTDPSLAGPTPKFGPSKFEEQNGMNFSPLTRALMATAPASGTSEALQKALPQEYQLQIGAQVAKSISQMLDPVGAAGAASPGGAAAPPAAGPAQPVARPQAANAGIPSWVSDRVAHLESGGDPGAKNPVSSALGPRQFINSTWMQYAPAALPQAQGMPSDQVLALRTDPAASNAVFNVAAQDYAKKIQAFTGQPATPTDIALAHQFGIGGALKIKDAANKDPNTPIDQVVGKDVMDRNPPLSKGGQPVTVGRLIQAVDSHMQPDQAGPAAQPGAAAAAAAAPQFSRSTRVLLAGAMQRAAQGDLKGANEAVAKAIELDPGVQGQIAHAKAIGENTGKPTVLAPGAIALPPGTFAVGGAPGALTGGAPAASGVAPAAPQPTASPTQAGAAPGQQQGGLTVLPGGGVENRNSPALVRLDGSRSAYNQARGASLGKLMTETQDAGESASGALRQINELRGALDGSNTGPGTETLAEAASAFQKSFGLDINKYLPTGLQTDPIKTQIAAKNINELATALAKSNFMTGASNSRITDADLHMAIMSTPNLWNLPGANKQLLDSIEQVQRLKIEKSRFFQKYEADHNQELDWGVNEAWAQHVAQNPNIPQNIKTAYFSLSDVGKSKPDQPMDKTPGTTLRFGHDGAGRVVNEVGPGKWQYDDGTPYQGATNGR